MDECDWTLITDQRNTLAFALALHNLTRRTWNESCPWQRDALRTWESHGTNFYKYYIDGNAAPRTLVGLWDRRAWRGTGFLGPHLGNSLVYTLAVVGTQNLSKLINLGHFLHNFIQTWKRWSKNKCKKNAHMPIWTTDLVITSHALYQLSYASWYMR